MADELVQGWSGDLMGSLPAREDDEPPEWLFDSRGNPVAWRCGADVFSKAGEFVGRLEDGELWNGGYLGELVRGDRLLRDLVGRHEERVPPRPARPREVPTLPAGCRGAIGLPCGYRDVRL